MAELILRPNGEGDLNQHLQLPDSGEHWEKVDEEVANDGADYVYGASTVGTKDLYTIPAHGLPPGTVIDSITLHGRFYRGTAPIAFNAVADWIIKSRGAEYTPNTAYIWDQWYTDSLDLPLNHATGNPWTLDDLTNLQIGSALQYAFGMGEAREGRNTQLYIVVTYTIVAPTVTTDPATGVTTVAANPNGTLDDAGGEACNCGFQWGETVAYGNTTPTQSKTTGQTFTQSLSGLDPNKTYHFRAFATNSAGTGYGADRTFVTLAIVLPTITTDPATDVEPTSATENGTLDGDGGEACDCGFEWGLTAAYGNTTPTQSKTTGQSFSWGISGLSPSTLYHFRAFATNAAGTSYGTDRTFTTDALPAGVTTPDVTTDPATGII